MGEIFRLHGTRSCKSVAKLSKGARIGLVKRAATAFLEKHKGQTLDARVLEKIHEDLDGYAKCMTALPGC